MSISCRSTPISSIGTAKGFLTSFKSDYDILGKCSKILFEDLKSMKISDDKASSTFLELTVERTSNFAKFPSSAFLYSSSVCTKAFKVSMKSMIVFSKWLSVNPCQKLFASHFLMTGS